MQHNKKRQVGIIAALMMVALAGATAEAANERTLFISLGSTARPPIGWVDFCAEHRLECETRPVEARDVVLTTTAWRDLVRINRWVNEKIKPLTDLEHWGVV